MIFITFGRLAHIVDKSFYTGIRKFVFLVGILLHHEFITSSTGFIPISDQNGKDILPFKIRVYGKEQIYTDLRAFCIVDAHV